MGVILPQNTQVAAHGHKRPAISSNRKESAPRNPGKPPADPSPERVAENHRCHAESDRGGKHKYDVEAATFGDKPVCTESEEEEPENKSAAESDSFFGFIRWLHRRFVLQLGFSASCQKPSVYLKLPGPLVTAKKWLGSCQESGTWSCGRCREEDVWNPIALSALKSSFGALAIEIRR